MSSAPGHSRLTKTHRVSIAGVAALGAASLALTLLPGGGSAEAGTQDMATVATVASQGSNTVQASIAEQHSFADKRVKDAAAAKAKAEAKVKADAKAKAAAKAKADAKKRADERAAASRAAARKPVYANNLDGWIREALAVMQAKGIPGSYDGLHRNIMRESTGNPRAMNGWDINAQNGTPSVGLLQVIQPTFNAYHVPGTPHDIYNPVSNITAAANYAADRYGSIDNVNGAY
ncbi:transglycosylase SLT domain-containing protein [Streptomyces sp. NPDC048442]|uniref:transglycosylase SLT domain-containing protein n=1 Tax=Streptomyces sp. NPDC048442 TaxID=3154823 RepID=UPI00344208A5